MIFIHLDVPVCTITQSEIDDEKVLICTADAHPADVEFEWSMVDSNDTIEDEAISQRGVQSIIKLEQLALDENPQVFSCIVNNTVGVSEACFLTVEGSKVLYLFSTLNFYLNNYSIQDFFLGGSGGVGQL